MKKIILYSIFITLSYFSCKDDKERIWMKEENAGELMKVFSESDWGGINNEIQLLVDLYEELLECGIERDTSGIIQLLETDSLTYNKNIKYSWGIHSCEENPTIIEFYSYTNWLPGSYFENEDFTYQYDGGINIIIVNDLSKNDYDIWFAGGHSGTYTNGENIQNTSITIGTQEDIEMDKIDNTFNKHSCLYTFTFNIDRYKYFNFLFEIN